MVLLLHTSSVAIRFNPVAAWVTCLQAGSNLGADLLGQRLWQRAPPCHQLPEACLGVIQQQRMAPKDRA